jgi:hypothetical protein
MSFANRHNKGSIDWGIDTKDFPFHTREGAYKADPDKTYVLKGLYINRKGNYGDHPVAICDGFFIDFPDYMTDDVKDILVSDEDIADIRSGKVGFKLEQFIDKKFKKTCYGVKWVDIEV